jgi:hypothetical protein
LRALAGDSTNTTAGPGLRDFFGFRAEDCPVPSVTVAALSARVEAVVAHRTCWGRLAALHRLTPGGWLQQFCGTSCMSHALLRARSVLARSIEGCRPARVAISHGRLPSSGGSGQDRCCLPYCASPILHLHAVYVVPPPASEAQHRRPKLKQASAVPRRLHTRKTRSQTS